MAQENENLPQPSEQVSPESSAEAEQPKEQPKQPSESQERALLLLKARGETEEVANAALPILCTLVQKHQRIPESPQERQNLVDHAFDLAQVVSAKARALLVSNLAAGGLDADGQWLENQPE